MLNLFLKNNIYKKLTLFVSMLSSLLFFYDGSLVNLTVFTILFYLVFIYLNDYDEKNTFEKRDVIVVLIICLILIIKGIYTYGSILRMVNKSFRWTLSIIFCVPNVYWISVFVCKIRHVIMEYLEFSKIHFVIRVTYLYSMFRLFYMLLTNIFPYLDVLESFNTISMFYLSIPINIYAVYRFLNVKKDLSFKLLYLFFISCVISTIANSFVYDSYSVIGSIPYGMNMLFNTIVFYSIGEYIYKNNRYDCLYNLIFLFVLCWTIFVLASLIIVHTGLKSNVFPNVYMQNQDGLSLYLNEHRNNSGTRQCVYLLLNVFLIFRTKNTNNKILLTICSIVNYVALVLINARAPLYSFLLIVLIYALIFCYKKNKSIKTILYIFVMFAVVYFLKIPIVNFYNYMSVKNVTTIFDAGVDAFESRPLMTHGFIMGRVMIWKTCIDYYMNNPMKILIGVTVFNVRDVILNSTLGWNINGMHNEIFQILIVCGIFPTLILIFLLIINIFKSVVLFFGKNQEIDIINFVLLFGVIFIMYIVIDGLFCDIRVPATMFFISIGVINARYKELK